MKAGDLIYWHGRNTIALVIHIDGTYPSELWVCLLEADNGMITYDYLEEGYTIIDENWTWPDWHINHKDNK